MDHGSDELGVSTETNLSQAVERADALADILEKTHLKDPIARLQGFLCATSVVSNKSSFAERQRAALFDPKLQRLIKIGKGCAGIVYEQTGENKVIKKAINRLLFHNLWNDFILGIKIGDAFNEVAAALNDLDLLPRVPKLYAFISPQDEDRFNRWWEHKGHKLPEEDQQKDAMIIEERVLPLPKPMREALIEMYCDPKNQPEAKSSSANKNCLARLQLGRRRRITTGYNQFFSLYNFQINLDQAMTICPQEIDRYASQMAAALAVMHFRCCVDANDVEFVLGSSPATETCLHWNMVKNLKHGSYVDMCCELPDFKHRVIHLWVIDFDKVKCITLDREGMMQAAKAAELNDPYFPKPVPEGHEDYPLWDRFRASYTQMARLIIERERHVGMDELPATFLDMWTEIRRQKTSGSKE